jgi:hypothetical protein
VSQPFEGRPSAPALLKRTVAGLVDVRHVPVTGLRWSASVSNRSGLRPGQSFSPCRSFYPRSRERSPSRAACALRVRYRTGSAQPNERSDSSAQSERRWADV